MRVDVVSVRPLRFSDGAPVRAASAIVAFGGGWLIAQDDATHAAWVRGGGATPVRVFGPVAGHEVFTESAGTKHLKPDLEAACEVVVGDLAAALLLGSGSSPERMRAALVRLLDDQPHSLVADLAPLYARVADRLEVGPDQLNLEGACLVGPSLRWFQRGLPAAGVPPGSVDLDLSMLLAAVTDGGDPSAVRITGARRYALGRVRDVGLGVTDAVSLDGGRVLVSAAAEDTPNTRDDGPVVGAALVVLDEGEVRESVELPPVHGRAAKVEGLTILDRTEDGLVLLATVDDDDPQAPSLGVHLRVRLH